ncbi:MAG: hypothetical protein FWG68_12080 [Defluviitaleaceae bacterium]|nr:hypothetical protein [Defluviitaleaceae bacterium]
MGNIYVQTTKNRGALPLDPARSAPLDPARSAPLDPLKFLMDFWWEIYDVVVKFAVVFYRGQSPHLRTLRLNRNGETGDRGRSPLQYASPPVFS